MFPRNRFQQAGATADELDQLEAEHQALPGNMAEWNEQRWSGQDVEGLRAALEVRRGHGIDGVELAAAESIEELADGATVTVGGVEISGEIGHTDLTPQPLDLTDEERAELPKLDEHPDPDAKPVAGRAKRAKPKPKPDVED